MKPNLTSVLVTGSGGAVVFLLRKKMSPLLNTGEIVTVLQCVAG